MSRSRGEFIVGVTATRKEAARLERLLVRNGLKVTLHDDGPAAGGLDAVILVLGELDRDGVRTIERARKTTPESALVIVVDSATRRTGREALAAGADAIVFRRDTDACLPFVVGAVCTGQVSLPSALRETASKPTLSPREKQVLGMVVMGFTNAEIAATLYLAETTVKSHLSSAFSKLGVRSRAQAAALILDPEGGLGSGILTISDDGSAGGTPDQNPSS